MLRLIGWMLVTLGVGGFLVPPIPRLVVIGLAQAADRVRDGE